MALLATYFVWLLTAVNVFAITNQGTPCLQSCSKWSSTLEYCYTSFGLSPTIKGYDYSNQFVACLCAGKNLAGEIGEANMTLSAGICQSCSTTPREIKADLSKFLTLCVIQAQNGSAANATTFAPLQYHTANDPDVGVATYHASSAYAIMPVLGSIAVLVAASIAAA